VSRRRRLLSGLDRLDEALAHRWPWRQMGDHTLYVLTRS